MNELAKYEEPEEVLIPEVMESRVLEENLEDWREACAFEFRGEFYIASMGTGAGWGLREPTIFMAYKHKGRWCMGDEEYTDRTARSLNGLIYEFEQDIYVEQGDPFGYEDGFGDYESTFQRMREATDHIFMKFGERFYEWGGKPKDPVKFAEDVIGKVVDVDLKDGKVVKVRLGDDTISE